MEYRILVKGQIIANRYRIEKTVGRGKNSAVYASFDQHTNSMVALKVLDPFLTQEQTSFIRFQREALIIRHLDHPQIIKVFDLFQDGALHLISMEYFESMNIQKHLKSNGPVSLPDFLLLAQKINSALEACHRKGILHRDIKPQNVLIDANKEIKLVDFGISKVNSMSDLTKTGTAIGTPEYMAPELFRSTQSDQRSDIFSLGVLLYEMLTGRPPFTGTNLSQILTKQMSGEFTPISNYRQDVPAWLHAVIGKCLHLAPDQRYQSCRAIQTDLEKADRALAHITARSTAPQCASCREELIPGMVFCHICGKFIETGFEKGNCSIILNHCDDPHGLAAFMTRQFPTLWSPDYRNSIERPPVLIAKNISEKSAVSLAAEMSPYYCELQIVSSLPTKYRLGKPEIIAAAVPVLALPFLTVFIQTVAQGMMFVALSEIIAIGAYFYRTQPLLSLKKRNGKGSSNQLASEFAKRITQLKEKKIKNTMGRIARIYIDIRKKKFEGTTLTNIEYVSGMLTTIFAAAAILEKYEQHLSATSLNALNEKCLKIDARLKSTAPDQDVSNLIEAKAKARENFQNYRDIQDAHCQLSVALVNFENVLERINGLAGVAANDGLIGEELNDLGDLFNNIGELRIAS